MRPGEAPVVIALSPTAASYVLFVHVVEDRPLVKPEGFGEIGPIASWVDGNRLGDRVSTHALRYADGSETEVPVLRRFALQHKHIAWSASPFGAMPLRAPSLHSSIDEDFALGRAASVSFMTGEERSQSGRTRQDGENLWVYALPNPTPHKELTVLALRAEQESSLVYAVSTTRLTQHPLRLQGRSKLKMRLPAGVHLNKLGELDVDDRGEQIAIDLGTVISARAVLEYSRPDWLGDGTTCSRSGPTPK